MLCQCADFGCERRAMMATACMLHFMDKQPWFAFYEHRVRSVEIFHDHAIERVYFMPVPVSTVFIQQEIFMQVSLRLDTQRFLCCLNISSLTA